MATPIDNTHPRDRLTSSLDFEANKKVKELIRQPYAWPGGYEKYAVTSDGAALCHVCVKEEVETIMYSTLHRMADGWQVVGLDLDCNTDESVYCDHCGRDITNHKE